MDPIDKKFNEEMAILEDEYFTAAKQERRLKIIFWSLLTVFAIGVGALAAAFIGG